MRGVLLYRGKPTILLRLLGRPIRSCDADASSLLSSFLRRLALPVLHGLLMRYRQCVDAEVLADGACHEDGPSEIHNHRENKVPVQVRQLDLRADGGETQVGQVGDDSAADQWEKHDGPVREGLARQVREDHLGSHTTEDEAHGKAEEHKVVLPAQGREGAIEPEADREEVDCEGRPLEKNRRQGQVLSAACLDYMLDTPWDVHEKSRDDDQDPNVAHGKIAKLVGVAESVLLAQYFNDWRCPNLWAVDTREGHDGGGNEQALGRAVEVAQVESVTVVSLPSREEHRNARAKGRENTRFGGAQAHGGSLEERGEGAVQGVDTVVEELTKPTRSAGAPRLLSIEVVHRLVHEEAQREAKIQPRRSLRSHKARGIRLATALLFFRKDTLCVRALQGRAPRRTYRSYEVWHEQDKKSDIAQNEEETDQGNHVRRKP